MPEIQLQALEHRKKMSTTIRCYPDFGRTHKTLNIPIREQVAQRSCACPMPGNVQGWLEWSSEEPVEGAPAHVREVGMT